MLLCFIFLGVTLSSNILRRAYCDYFYHYYHYYYYLIRCNCQRRNSNPRTNHDAQRRPHGEHTEKRQSVRGPEKKRGKGRAYRLRHHNLGCAFIRKQCTKIPAEDRGRSGASRYRAANLRFCLCNDFKTVCSSSCIPVALQPSVFAHRGNERH